MKENSTIPAEVKSEGKSDRASALNQELFNALNQKGSAEGEKPRDLLVIMKDLLSLEKNSSSEDDKNKLNTRAEILSEKEGDKSDLFLKLMLALAGAVAIGASGGAGFALLAGGAGMLPVLPQLIEEGKKLFGMGDDKQSNAQTDLEKDLPKKMLAASLLEIANSGKSLVADFIFSKESPIAEKIKSYTDSLSKMTPDQRNAELDNLRNEVTNLASNQPSTKPDLSKKIDGIFEGLKEVLEGKSSEKKEGEKEGERDILGELKKNLSVRGFFNSDGSVTTLETSESETQKKEGGDKGEKSENKDGVSKEDKPSPAPASRGDGLGPRANLIEGAKGASRGEQ